MAGCVTGSLVWDLFARTETGGECNTFNKYIPTKHGNTSGMIRHLALHKEPHKEYLEKKNAREAIKEKEKEAGKKRKCHFDQVPTKQPKLDFKPPSDSAIQNKFEDALLEYIADFGVSFRQAAGLKDLISVVNRKIKVPSRWSLARKTNDKAKKVLNEVKNIMAAVRASEELVSIGFTTDLWTSRAGDSYISLTCSFIDHNWRLHRWTPFVRHFPGRHTGERIALKLDNMIEELGLDDLEIKKWSVNDNASNQKKAIEDSNYLQEYNCDIHTMQLGIGDTFKETNGMTNVLENSKGIAKFTNQSTVALEQLKAECKAQNVRFRKPKNPNETRWNSSYACMDSIFHLRKPLGIDG